MIRLVGLRLALAAGAALGALLGLQHTASAANRAALVVELSSGRLWTACVSFANQISGFDLIRSSGIEYQAQVFGSMGEAICQLDNEPAQLPANCFGSGPYWQYFHRTSSGWAQSAVGASGWTLHDGDMDGWHFATGAGQVPPAMAFAQVCPPAAAPAASKPPQTVAAPITTVRASSRASAAAPAPTIQPVAPASAPTASVQPSARALPRTGSRPAAAVVSHPPWGSIAALAIVLALLIGTAARLVVRRSPP
jgi:hypothetical protein